jgi:hypothetical protein
MAPPRPQHPHARWCTPHDRAWLHVPMASINCVLLTSWAVCPRLSKDVQLCAFHSLASIDQPTHTTTPSRWMACHVDALSTAMFHPVTQIMSLRLFFLCLFRACLGGEQPSETSVSSLIMIPPPPHHHHHHHHHLLLMLLLGTAAAHASCGCRFVRPERCDSVRLGK